MVPRAPLGRIAISGKKQPLVTNRKLPRIMVSTNSGPAFEIDGEMGTRFRHWAPVRDASLEHS